MIRVAELLPGDTVGITFTATAVNAPEDFTSYTNTASASFTLVRADGQTIGLNTVSNTVVVTLDQLPPVETPDLTVVKSANAATAVVGQTITYTISLTNTSSTNINNIVLRNLINEGLRFLVGSNTINGTLQPRASSLSVPVGSLLPNESIIVTVQAVVLALPPSGQIVNRAIIEYNGISVPSNAVVLPVLQSRLIVEKSVSTTVAFVGQLLTFQIVIRNEGTATAFNAKFRDPINFGIRIDASSIRVNDVLVPLSSNILDGLPLGDIPGGSTVVVTFHALVDGIPANAVVINQAFVDAEQIVPDSPIVPISVPSNIISVSVLDNEVRISKSTAATSASIGSVIGYTVDVQNRGATAISNFVLRDILPPVTRYVPNSLTVEGILKQLGRAPFVLEIPVGNVPPGQIIQIAFQLAVVAVPVQGEIANRMIATYEKQLPTGDRSNIIEFSNTSITPFVDVRMAKRVSQTTASSSDIITYFIDLHNNSNLTISNVLVRDQLPGQVTVLADTVRINGVQRVGANVIIGVPLQLLPPGQSVTVSFEARIDSQQGRIENVAVTTFDVQFTDGTFGRGTLQARATVRIEEEEEE